MKNLNYKNISMYGLGILVSVTSFYYLRKLYLSKKVNNVTTTTNQTDNNTTIDLEL